MNKKEKETSVAFLKGKFEESGSAIFVDFCGLKVEEVTQLRRELREKSGEMLVVKNTLARIAARGTQYEEAVGEMAGPTAVVFSSEITESAKVLVDFAKGHGKLELKFCVLKEKRLNLEEIRALAELPSREEILSQLAGVLNAPASKLVGQLAAPGQQLVSVLQAWIDKNKEE